MEGGIGVKIEITGNCMLSCGYCPQCHEGGEFPRELVPYLAGFLRGTGRKLVIDFFGGEPLLAFGKISEIVGTMKINRVPVERYQLITNGVLLDRDMAGYLGRNRFDVTVSLDGNEETHNKNRGGPGINSHQRAMRALGYIKEGGFPFRVSSVYHLNTLSRLDRSIPFLLSVCDWDPGRISMNPAIGFRWGESDFRSLRESLESLVSSDPSRFREFRDVLVREREDIVCSMIYIDKDGDVYPTNLFNYKKMCDPVNLRDIRDPGRTIRELLARQEELRGLEFDEEQREQFRITGFVNDFFRNHPLSKEDLSRPRVRR